MALLGFNLLASLLITLVVVLGLMQFEDWWLSEEKLELTTKKREKSSLDMGIEAAQARRKIREENTPRGKVFQYHPY
ncbi:MAG: hypothetical protein HC796_02940 [Synechococcaceae cyanobacterium RL_1_2]|nr:hypothetical protein [Synechococcaceae cyanobacterium RL_1_2]